MTYYYDIMDQYSVDMFIARGSGILKQVTNEVVCDMFRIPIMSRPERAEPGAATVNQKTKQLRSLIRASGATSEEVDELRLTHSEVLNA